jgi:hypothetical protein
MIRQHELERDIRLHEWPLAQSLVTRVHMLVSVKQRSETCMICS